MSTSPGSEWQKLLQSYCDNIMLPPKKYGKLPLIPLSPPQSSSATLSPDQPDLGKGYSSWTYLAHLEFNWLVVGYMILALDQAKEGRVAMG